MDPKSPRNHPTQHPVTVSGHRTLSPGVVELTVALPTNETFSFQPGQWVNLGVDLTSQGLGLLTRSYSIASAPGPDDRAQELSFAITRVPGGPVSNYLCDCRPGDSVQLEGPFGFFTLERVHAETPMLWVATGTGITPFRSMAHSLGDSRGKASPRVQVLFGTRTQEDILYAEDFGAMPGIDHQVTLSRPDENWPGLRGYVQDHLDALIAARPPEHVFVCGLSDMVKAVRAHLKEKGFVRQQIHTERYD